MNVWGLFPKLTSFLCFRQFHWCPDGKREKNTSRVVFQIRSARETPALITNNNPYQQRKKAWLKRPWQEMVSRGDLGLAEGPVCGDTMHSIWRERILSLPNKNRMQTSHQICFFHGFFFFFLPFPYWQKLEGISMLPREVSCGCIQLYHGEGAEQRNPWQKDGTPG